MGKRHRQAAQRHGSDKGLLWLQLMENAGATRQLVQGPKEVPVLWSQDPTGGVAYYQVDQAAQPVNWGMVAIAMFCFLGAFACLWVVAWLLLKKSKKSPRNPDHPRRRGV